MSVKKAKKRFAYIGLVVLSFILFTLTAYIHTFDYIKEALEAAPSNTSVVQTALEETINATTKLPAIPHISRPLPPNHNKSDYYFLPDPSENPLKKQIILTQINTIHIKTVYDHDYLSVLMILYQLLHANATKVDTTKTDVGVLVYSDLGANRMNSLLDLGARLVVINCKKKEAEEPANNNEKWGGLFPKIFMFNLTEYEKVLYYSPDFLFTGTPEPVFEKIPDKNYNTDHIIVGAVQDRLLESGVINTGMYLLHPNKDSYQVILNIAKKADYKAGQVEKHVFVDFFNVTKEKKVFQERRFNAQWIKLDKFDKVEKDHLIALHENFWLVDETSLDQQYVKLWKNIKQEASQYQLDHFNTSDFMVQPDPKAVGNQTCLIFLWLIGDVSRRYDVPRLMSNRERYISFHPECTFHVTDKLDPPTVSHPVWQKVYDLEKFVDQHTWFWLLDSDALIMNHRIDIIRDIINPIIVRYPKPEEINVIIAKDCNGINAGSLLVKSSPWTKQLIKLWKSLEPDFLGGYREQGALSHIIEKNYLNISDHIAFVPLYWINAYAGEYCGFKEVHGTNIAYHAPGMGYDHLVRYVKEKDIKEIY